MITTPISDGEFCDKLTILRIKEERLPESNRPMAEKEYKLLRPYYYELEARLLKEQGAPVVQELRFLMSQLESCNKTLWDIEEKIRVIIKTEPAQGSQRFVELAYLVPRNNDLRAQIKMKINRLTGSELEEAKSYC